MAKDDGEIGVVDTLVRGIVSVVKRRFHAEGFWRICLRVECHIDWEVMSKGLLGQTGYDQTAAG